MKAAVMRAYHQPLEFDERPVPEPVAPSDVLIRIGGAGVCATDLHALEGLDGAGGVTLPLVLGHENAGWVEEVGSGVTTRRRKGDAVLVYPPRSCGLCLGCRRGNDMYCAGTSSPASRSTAASPTTSSSPSARSCSFPQGIEPAEVAPHSDAGLTAYHAVQRLGRSGSPRYTAVLIGVGGGRPHRAPADARARLELDDRRRTPM